jgi:autotransporter-associated beta strand protein
MKTQPLTTPTQRPPRFRARSLLLPALAAAALWITPDSRASSATWVGGNATSGSFVGPENWQGGVVPTFDATLDIFFHAPGGSAHLSEAAGANATFIAGSRVIRSYNFTDDADGTINIRNNTNGSIGQPTLTLGNATNAGSINVTSGASGAINIGPNNGGNINLGNNLTVTHSGNGTLTTSKAITGNFGVIKTGAGTWVAAGANSTFSGPVAIQNGVLSAASIGNVTVSSHLGQPLTAANGTISLGTGSAQRGILKYTGTGGTTDRTIKLAGTNSGGQTLDQSGTGLLKFTGNTVSANQGYAYVLRLDGSTAGTGEFAGVIKDGTSGGKISLRKDGNGTWALSGNNTYTGNTTVNAGTLLVQGNQTAASGNATVSSGAAIGGTGTLGGNLVINAGGKFVFNTASLTIAPGKTARFGDFGVNDVIGLQNGAVGSDYLLIKGGGVDFTNISDMGSYGMRYLGGGKGAYFLNNAGNLKVCIRAMEPEVDVFSFGAVPDDGLDDAPAFTAAFNYIVAEGGGSVLAPPGAYDFNSRVSIDAQNKQLALYGYGKGVTSLSCNNSTGLMRFSNSQWGILLMNVSITAKAGGGNAGTAVEVTNPSLSDPSVNGIYMCNVLFTTSGTDYFYRHVKGDNVRNAVFIDVFIDSSGKDLSNAGIYLTSGDNAHFENCYSKNNGTGFYLGSYKGDVTFNRCIAVGNNHGFDVRAAAVGDYLPVNITGAHANTHVSNINLQNASSAYICEAASYVQNIQTEFTDIKLYNCANVNVVGCVFHQPYCPYRTSVWVAGTCHEVTIKQNIFNGVYSPDYGNMPNPWYNRVYINSSSYNVWEYDNLYPATPQW